MGQGPGIASHARLTNRSKNTCVKPQISQEAVTVSLRFATELNRYSRQIMELKMPVEAIDTIARHAGRNRNEMKEK